MRITHQSQILASVVLALAALAATHPVMAQSKLNVPFNFVADGKSYPAGTYTVSQDFDFRSVALHGGGNTLTRFANPNGEVRDSSKVVLSFVRVGSTYYLRTIQYRSMVTPRLDPKVKEAIPGPEVATLGQ
jgi:hypothetical protein